MHVIIFVFFLEGKKMVLTMWNLNRMRELYLQTQLQMQLQMADMFVALWS